jgi:nucleoside permease NupC
MVNHASWLMGIEQSESWRAAPMMAQKGNAPAS